MTTKYLMNPATGSVDTEESWAAEMQTWSDDQQEAQRQFESLIEVELAEDGNWKEIE